MENWLSLTPTKGNEGTTSIMVRAKSGNVGRSPRQMVIRVSQEDGQYKDVTIRQQSQGPVFSIVSDLEYEIPNSGGTITVSGLSNCTAMYAEIVSATIDSTWNKNSDNGFYIPTLDETKKSGKTLSVDIGANDVYVWSYEFHFGNNMNPDGEMVINLYGKERNLKPISIKFKQKGVNYTLTKGNFEEMSGYWYSSTGKGRCSLSNKDYHIPVLEEVALTSDEEHTSAPFELKNGDKIKVNSVTDHHHKLFLVTDGYGVSKTATCLANELNNEFTASIDGTYILTCYLGSSGMADWNESSTAFINNKKLNPFIAKGNNALEGQKVSKVITLNSGEEITLKSESGTQLGLVTTNSKITNVTPIESKTYKNTSLLKKYIVAFGLISGVPYEIKTPIKKTTIPSVIEREIYDFNNNGFDKLIEKITLEETKFGEITSNDSIGAII